jgi:hypothetical protein
VARELEPSRAPPSGGNSDADLARRVARNERRSVARFGTRRHHHQWTLRGFRPASLGETSFMNEAIAVVLGALIALASSLIVEWRTARRALRHRWDNERLDAVGEFINASNKAIGALF